MEQTRDWHPNYSLQHVKQIDSYNCGVFCAQFLKRLLSYDLILDDFGNSYDELLEIRLNMEKELKSFKKN
jgi:hypothetical protein